MSQLIPNLKYKELFNIDLDFFAEVKTIFIFSDNDVLLITKSNEVYAYGCNTNGRLGLGTRSHVLKPAIIPELSHKGVTNIMCGQHFMIAITETMDIYVWGYSDLDIYSKPRKISGKKEMYIKYCCGFTGAYILTDSNILYHVDCSIRHENWTLNPLSLCNNKVIDISCGEGHMLALTDDGRVFACGANSFGQLGLGITLDKTTPQLIPNFRNIKSIFCGYSHSLLLTFDGKIYSAGYNNNGQLGIGNKRSQLHFQLIKTNARYVDIFAFKNISFALSESNYVAIWGDLRGCNVLYPLQTSLNSFQDAIDIYCLSTFLYKPISANDALRKEYLNPIMVTMAKSFNNQTHSDLKFKLKRKKTGEFDYIYCHKWFIASASEYFERMFANEWSENKENEIIVNDHSYEAFYQFIQCLYTDKIDNEDVELLIEIFEMCEKYLHERIKTKCVNFIIPRVNIENICSIYSSSLKYRSIELEEHAFQFILENIKEITKTKDFQKMEGNDIKYFLTRFYRD